MSYLRATTTNKRKAGAKPTYKPALGEGPSTMDEESCITALSGAHNPSPALAQDKGTGPKTLPSTQPANEIEMEEDDLLRDSPQEEETKLLLGLRQKYKKTVCNLAKVNSHLSFVYSCKNKDKTPKGLQVHVQCNALLADMSNVKDKFNCTKVSAESEFTQALEDHYKTTKEILEQELSELNRTITQTVLTVRHEVKREHDEMMAKTKENIKKHEERLQATKKKKLETLERPTRRREQRPAGMRYNRDNYSPRRKRTPYTRGNRDNISSQNDSGGKPKHTQQPSRTQTVTNNAPTAHTPPQEMVQLASLLHNMMQQTHQVQQPPPLPAPPPCAPGL